MARTPLIALHQALNRKHEILDQIAGACWRAAGDVENEDPGTDNHANRLVWAAEVRHNRKNKALEMLDDVLKNAAIATDVDAATDNDVLFVVASLIDTFATGA